MAKSIIIKCDNCNKEYKIYKNWFDRNPTHCCSIFCSAELKSKNKKGRRKTKISICPECGNTFSHFGYDKQIYCSRECHYKKKKIKAICDTCGNVILKNKATEQRNEFNYCSKKCYHNRKKDGLKKLKRHTNFFMSLVESGCECGVKEYYLLQIHHKDGDNNNNSFDNLEVVCANCHIKRHLKLNKKGKLVYHTRTLTSIDILKLIYSLK